MAVPNKPNDVVEDFTAQDQDDHTVKLSDFAAQRVVLFFYPRAIRPDALQKRAASATRSQRSKTPARLSSGSPGTRSRRRRSLRRSFT